jgi:antitoxin component YwqK of YwqJK toxin-antitoxin module
MYNGEYYDIDVNTVLTADIEILYIDQSEKPLNGVYIRWDSEGQLEEVSMFKDGQLHGE